MRGNHLLPTPKEMRAMDKHVAQHMADHSLRYRHLVSKRGESNLTYRMPTAKGRKRRPVCPSVINQTVSPQPHLRGQLIDPS